MYLKIQDSNLFTWGFWRATYVPGDSGQQPFYLGILDRVKDGQTLLQTVEPVVRIGLLKAEVQVHFGAVHLLERLLELARLQHGHHLAVEGQPVPGLQVQDTIAHLQAGKIYQPLIMLNHRLIPT